jgi:DNA-binding MarR family transcriptional regulator
MEEDRRMVRKSELAKAVSQAGQGRADRRKLTTTQAQQLILAVASFGLTVTRAIQRVGGDPDSVRGAPLVLLVTLLLYGEQRPRDLGAAVGMNSANMARLLDRLEASSFIERRYNRVEGDRRAILVSITDDGAAYTNEVSTVLASYLPSGADLSAALSDIVRAPRR